MCQPIVVTVTVIVMTVLIVAITLAVADHWSICRMSEDSGRRRFQRVVRQHMVSVVDRHFAENVTVANHGNAIIVSVGQAVGSVVDGTVGAPAEVSFSFVELIVELVVEGELRVVENQ